MLALSNANHLFRLHPLETPMGISHSSISFLTADIHSDRVCVMFVTFFDTCMVSLAALIVWRLNPFLVFIPWLTISCLDGLYLSSALTKVPDGAWFTLTLATVLACLFILWRFGKEQQWQAEVSDRFPTSHLVQKGPGGILQLTDAFGGSTLSTVKGFGIFFDKAGETTPAVFTHFLTKLVAAPQIMVFFHLRPLETPSVSPENRYHVSRLGIPNCYRLIVRHGFMEAVITPDLASLVIEQIRDFLIRKDAARKKAVDRRPGTPEDEKLFIPHPRPGETLHATLTRTATASSSIDPKTVSEQPEDAGEKEDNEHHNLEPKLTWDCKIEDRNISETPTDSENTDDKLSRALASLDAAYAHQILYIIGKEEMRVTPIQSTTALGPKVKSVFRKVLLMAFLWLRDNTRTKIANLGVPTDRLIEVGFVKEV
jgi:KUP system potassium uptake protein